MMKKKRVFMLAVTMFTFVAAFAQEPAVFKVKETGLPNLPAKETKTIETAMSVSRSILEGNWAKLDSLLDENFTYTGDGMVLNKDQYMGFMQNMRSAFSNFEMSLEKGLVENNFATFRFDVHAINTGKFMGAPANKKNIEVTGIFMRKIENGKLMQEWQTTDLLGVMTQIGGGSLFFYSIFVGGFNVNQDPPARMPNDFLHIDGEVKNFDLLSAKQKKKYLKKYYKSH